MSEPHVERRKPTKVQAASHWFVLVVIPILLSVVATTMGWVLLAVVESQKDIVAMRLQIAGIQQDIAKHDSESREDSMGMGRIHHTARIFPCNGCHK